VRHAYTANQALVDPPDKDRRRGRATAADLGPSSMGAAKATTQALPAYRGRFDGLGVRAPCRSGSIADIVCLVERPTSTDEVNRIVREEAASLRHRDIVDVSDEALVSTDIIQSTRASIIDCSLTRAVDGDVVKVMSWYVNEWAYAGQLLREAKSLARIAVGLDSFHPFARPRRITILCGVSSTDGSSRA